MTERRIRNPGIAYTYTHLEKYAKSHGVDADTPFTPAIDALSPFSRGNISLRLGYGLAPIFETERSVPPSIPMVLSRLAIFDSRLRGEPALLPEEHDQKFGVFADKVSWLRLVRVAPTDKRVGEILSIVGADYKKGIECEERDEHGNRVPYTKHYYMESNQYAVRVVQHPLQRHLGIPVTGIELALPGRLTNDS